MRLVGSLIGREACVAHKTVDTLLHRITGGFRVDCGYGVDESLSGEVALGFYGFIEVFVLMHPLAIIVEAELFQKLQYIILHIVITNLYSGKLSETELRGKY